MKKEKKKCKHIWGKIAVISFHKKNCCMASQCHKCNKKKTIRGISYSEFDGYTALIIDDYVKKILKLYSKF